MNTSQLMGIEQRQSPRRQLPIRAILTMAGVMPMTVRTVDIGQHGVGLIGITRPLLKGQEVSVALEMFFKGKIRNIRTSASVAHCVEMDGEGYKVGLQFLELDPRGAALLRQYIGH